MRPPWLPTSALLLSACVAGLGLAGCAKDTTAPDTSEHVNEDKPNANARVLAQVIFGAEDRGTTVNQLGTADDASYPFLGSIDSYGGVGVLNPNGSLRWFQRTTFTARGIASQPATSVVPRGLVVVGAHDTNGDGQSDVGYASLYTSTGRLLGQVLVASDTTRTWFNDLIQVSDSAFVAIGGDFRAGVAHPRLMALHLRAPGVLERGATVILPSIIGYFYRIVVLPPTAGDLALVALSFDGASYNLHGLGVPWPSLDPVAVAWTHEISSAIGPVVDVEGLEQSGGSVYLAGSVEDNRKALDAGGGVWNSGLVASYAGSGEEQWSTVVSLSGKGEHLRDVAIGPDGVYAVGRAAFSVYASQYEFGYGLIAKLDQNTGQLIASYTIGDDRYASGFNTVRWTSGSVSCGGFTGYDVRNGPYQGWFSTVDVSGVPVAASALAPDSAGSGSAEPAAAPASRGRDLR